MIMIQVHTQLFQMKARDVVSGKKPLDEFIDPRVRDEVNIEDFVLILKIAVLCVAHSSVGRPTIKDVFEEMDKALTNTDSKVRITLFLLMNFLKQTVNILIYLSFYLMLPLILLIRLAEREKR